MATGTKKQEAKSKKLVAVITVVSEVKYTFVQKGIQTRQTGQYKAKLTFSPLLLVEPLTTVITAITVLLEPLSRKVYSLVGLQQQLHSANCMTVCIKQRVFVQTLNNF